MRPDTKSEVRQTLLVMSIFFIWSITIMFIISGIFRLYWLWNLSWILIPFISLIVGFWWDGKITKVPVIDSELFNLKSKPGGIWAEFDGDKVTIFDTTNGSIKQMVHSAKMV